MANVVITGSTKGIGKGLALEFIQRGHNVSISSRNQADVNSTVTELSDAGPGRAIGTVCDVSQKDQLQNLWDQTAAEFSSIDIWINNAGTATAYDGVQDFPEKVVHTLIDSNLKGAIFGSQVAISGFLEQDHGALYNMLGGSFNAKNLTPRMSVYSATKGAIWVLTKYLIKENESSGIMVGAISPGILISDNWLAQQKLMAPEEWQRRKPILNILCDHVDTAAPWLTDQVINNQKHGHRIAWLTNSKLTGRFIQAYLLRRRRDLFSRYSLS